MTIDPNKELAREWMRDTIETQEVISELRWDLQAWREEMAQLPGGEVFSMPLVSSSLTDDTPMSTTEMVSDIASSMCAIQEMIAQQARGTENLLAQLEQLKLRTRALNTNPNIAEILTSPFFWATALLTCLLFQCVMYGRAVQT